MAKGKSSKGGIVFSTNPDYMSARQDSHFQPTVPPQQQNLRIHLDRLKGNKLATRIAGFTGSDDDLKDLGKTLKSQCGVGGTAKDGIIILQGDVRPKAEAYLTANGYKHKRSGG
ncbi:MAG: translation initiation factor [Bacteroidia bacterium]|nr:translation initiation factor [Bacteroidia bacterium]